MACCAAVLTEAGREKLWASFIFLSIILCIANLCVIIYAIYISVFVAQYIPTEKAIIIFIYSVFAMSGMELLTYYCLGIRVSKKSFVKAHKKNSNYLLRIWLFSGYSMVFNMVIIGTMTASLSNHLCRSIHHSLERGMVLYFRDVVWKKSIDNLQYTMQCCGVHGYEDWHRISWINSNVENRTSQECNHTENIQIYLPVEPWSCCRLNYSNACYHDTLQLTEKIDINEKLKSINQIGCMQKITQPLQNGFIFFILISYMTLFLQIALTILSRCLYSSYRNAIILGDVKQTAPGWLWGVDNDLTKMINESIHTNSIKNNTSDNNIDRKNDACDENQSLLSLPVNDKQTNTNIKKNRNRGGKDENISRKIKREFSKIMYFPYKSDVKNYETDEISSLRTDVDLEYEIDQFDKRLETDERKRNKNTKIRKQKINEIFTDTSSTAIEEFKNNNIKTTRCKYESDDSVLFTPKVIKAKGTNKKNYKVKKIKRPKKYEKQVIEYSLMADAALKKSKTFIKNAINRFTSKKDYKQTNKICTSDESDRSETISEIEESLFLKNLS